MRQWFVGIDVSKAKHVAALIDQRKEPQVTGLVFPDDRAGYERLLRAIGNVAQPQDQVRVCLEATGSYGHRVAEFLAEQPGFSVTMVNPRQSHHFAQVLLARTKTDPVDALLLARYAQAMQPAASPPARSQQLARLTRSRHTLQESLTAQSNLLRSLLERVNPALEREFRNLICATALAVLCRYPTGQQLARARLNSLAGLNPGRRRLGRSRAVRLKQSAHTIPGEQGANTDTLLVRQLVASIRQLQHTLASLDEAILNQVRGHLLFTIPGLGSHTIAVVLAELPAHQLATSAQAVAFAGLNPRLRQSGRLCGKVKLSKCGPPALRRALYMAVVASLRCNPVLQSYYQHKRAQGKRPKAAIIACMSKLLRIIFALLKTGQPFHPNYEATRPRSPSPCLATT